MDLGLEGKVVVVTGAGKGIGLAVARAFAEEGAKVVAGSRNPGEALGALAARYPVVPVAVDLGTPEGPAELVGRAAEEFGGPDVLINNVGGAEPRMGGFLSVSDEDWRGTLEINLMSAVRACRAALPGMLERGAGVVVNVSSMRARQPVARMADYAAAKAAMTNLSKALSEEFGPRGIRATTVSPGSVRTPLQVGEGRFVDKMAKAMGVGLPELLEALPERNGITLGRMAEADEVAALVLFIASEKASMVTGSDYLIDGGMVKTI